MAWKPGHRHPRLRPMEGQLVVFGRIAPTYGDKTPTKVHPYDKPGRAMRVHCLSQHQTESDRPDELSVTP